jgi:hypothetical protein
MDVVVREPNHPKPTLLLEPTRPSLTVLFLRSVRVTVHLDDELGRGAVEVDDEWTDGVLVSELEVLDLTNTQGAPKGSFGRGWFATRLACAAQ